MLSPRVQSGRRGVLAAGVAAMLLASGCAQLASGTRPQGTDAWSGRMSLRIDSQPVQTFSALFELRGSPESGELSLTSPIGSTLAQLHWSPGEALLKNGSEVRRYESVDALIDS